MQCWDNVGELSKLVATDVLSVFVMIEISWSGEPRLRRGDSRGSETIAYIISIWGAETSSSNPCYVTRPVDDREAKGKSGG